MNQVEKRLETVVDLYYRPISRLLAARPQLLGLMVSAAFLIAIVPSLFLRPLWYDELLTHWLVTSPDWVTFSERLKAGWEPTPPLYMTINFLLVRLMGDQAWVIRLPTFLGFAWMSFALSRFVTRRLGSPWGAVAVCLVLLSGAVYYAQEARPYGLVFGAAATAMVAWQDYAETSRPRSAWLCGLALFIAGSLHYYAVLISFPFVLAEAVRFLETRRIDWRMLPVVAAPVLALAAHYPIIRPIMRSQDYYPIAWSQPSFGFPSLFWQHSIVPGITVLMLLLVLAFWLRPVAASESSRMFSAAESALLTGFFLLPWVGLVFAKFFTNAIVPRYIYTTVLGVAAISTGLLSRLLPRTAPAIVLFLAGAIGFYGALEARWQWRHGNPGELDLSLAGSYDALPIVMDDYLRYAQLSHYAPESTQRRIYYLTDRENMKLYTRAGQMEILTANVIKSGALSGRTREVEEFLAEHSRFLLFEPIRPDPQESWMIQAVIAHGGRLSLLGVRSGGRWYLGESTVAAAK